MLYSVRRHGLLRFFAVLILIGHAQLPAQTQPAKGRSLPRVPVETMHHAEWLNKDFEIEDRISEFTKHGTKYDVIKLKGTPVPLHLPPQLRLDRPSPLPRGRFTGRLIKIGLLYEFMVSTMELLPSEKEELASKVAALSPTNAQKRLEIAAWGEAVSNRYKDKDLMTTVNRLRTEAYQIMGTAADPPGSRPGTAALDAARDAKEADADPTTIKALAHQGFLRAVEGIKDQAGLEQLSREVAEYLPDSKLAQPGKIDEKLLAEYRKTPLKTYLEASRDVQKRLDRQLMYEVMEKGLIVAVTNNPKSVESLVDTAKRLFPEHPELAENVQNQGLLKLVDTSLTLSRDDLIKLVNQVRDKFGQAELARQLARKWLDNRQATQLADGDAEGRYSIAQDYLSLLGDRRSAAALLRECLKIDPEMKKAEDSLAGLGWKRDGERWIDPDETEPKESSDPAAPMPNLPGGNVARFPAPPVPNQPNPPPATNPTELVGQTQQQVAATYGLPEQKSRVATQGQITEQWIYETPSGRQIIQFLQKSARAESIVRSVYVLPKR